MRENRRVTMALRMAKLSTIKTLVALVLDQRQVADPRIALAKLEPVPFRASRTIISRARFFSLASVGNITAGCTVVVDDHASGVGRLQRPSPCGDREALLQQHLQLLLAHALAPARQRRAVEHRPVLEQTPRRR